MNDRKMSRRSALALTAAAATGAVILADAKPALATWPTITSPSGTSGLVGTSRKGGDITGALTAANKAISEMLAGGHPDPVIYQGVKLTDWKLIEDVLVAAAAAVEQYQEDPHKPEWHWKSSRKPNPKPHPKH